MWDVMSTSTGHCQQVLSQSRAECPNPRDLPVGNLGFASVLSSLASSSQGKTVIPPPSEVRAGETAARVQNSQWCVGCPCQAQGEYSAASMQGALGYPVPDKGLPLIAGRGGWWGQG